MQSGCMEPTEFPFSNGLASSSRRTILAGLRAHSGWESHPGVRAGARLTRGERAADSARDLLGSWPCVGAVVILVTIATALVSRHDHYAGAVALLNLVVSGFALVAVSLVLMAVRRIDRTASEQALYDLGSARQAHAVTEEVLGELDQINSGLARLAARVETLNIKCRAAGDDP
jgi:uncharacterized membrane protein